MPPAENQPPRPPNTTKKAWRIFLFVCGLAIIAAVAVVLSWKTLSKANEARSAGTPEKVTWRIRLFARKASGHIPDLSWRELWFMARQRGGFGMEFLVEGFSPEGSIRNPFVTGDDTRAASKVFATQCAICHGADGVGGEHGAPALNHPGLRHGDSDFAIYKVLRNGVPNTAMQPPPMSILQRWQLAGYVRHLQLHHEAQAGAEENAIRVSVSPDRILSAGTKTDEWLTYSGSLDGHRYSSLNQITPANVAQLRPRWIRQLDTEMPSSETTPIVAGGVIYITEPPSDTMAVDAIEAKTGKLIWRYSRSVSLDVQSLYGRMTRGVAILNDKIYFVTLDGYLVCLDADNGSLVWETKAADETKGYSLSGAPLVVKTSIIVGVAGGEYGIRGF